MDERPFFDKSIKPTKQTLQAVLGSTYTYYKKITSLVSAYSQEWTFSKSGGWMLKTYDHNKALFYLIPLKDGFKISLAFRENERAAFLRGGENSRDWRSLPSYILGAGIFGLILYQTSNVTLLRVGGMMMITLIIISQLSLGIVIDHYGLFGIVTRHIDLPRTWVFSSCLREVI